jgi:hypothetical protein
MKLLRELRLDSMPDLHLSLDDASMVSKLRYDRYCRPLRDEVARAR